MEENTIETAVKNNETAEHNSLCVGIDLGTTNSVIATCQLTDTGKLRAPVSKIEMLTEIGARNARRRERQSLLPSCVYYYDMKNGEYEPIVGELAKKMFLTQPYAVAKSIKRQMGKQRVEINGWKKEYPDQTPEQVSSRILSHVLDNLKNYYNEEIRDVVITVPANFDPAMRLATLKAAELAGVNVRKPDGTYNDEEILLSEPEAVMYALINQIQNGEININMDFSQKRRVLVFDIGGGTLDITLHEIERNPENPDLFNITSLATNRYSNIAGDIFDAKLAEAMYQKYVTDYQAQDAQIAARIKSDPYAMPNLLNYAEELKVILNDQVGDYQRRGKETPDSKDFDYGGIMSNGYSSESSMSKKEFEECLAPLLAPQMKFEDYRRCDTLDDERNIIYPILDVLKKAADKLGTGENDALHIDAVVLNGGMSRLYMIEKRLADFFGFKPITILDPDLSVAQGAAVYHYYLHQQNSLTRRLHRNYMEDLNAGTAPLDDSLLPSLTGFPEASASSKVKLTSGIETKSIVLPESLYLGLRGGSTYPLVESGQELPFDSPEIPGFLLLSGQKLLRIPIKHRIPHKEDYVTIASGDIEFARKYDSDVHVTIKFHLSRNQILSFEAWCSGNYKGEEISEKGSVVITVGDSDSQPFAPGSGYKPLKNAILPPSGSKLNVSNELALFAQTCAQLGNTKKNLPINKYYEKLRQQKKILASCGNPQEFADKLLQLLANSRSDVLLHNLFPVARKMCVHWPEAANRRLARYCVGILKNTMFALEPRGIRTSVQIEAIQTLGVCGDEEQCISMKVLCDNPAYRSALLYAFGIRGVNINWLYQELLKSVAKKISIQGPLRAIGLAMQRSRPMSPGAPSEEKVVRSIISIIEDGDLQENELVLGIAALGLICDQRPSAVNPVSRQFADRTDAAIKNIERWYNEETFKYTSKARGIANSLINGMHVSDDDEKYLLDIFNKE
jgi:molecular chaperone DnaK (HSP70)